MENNTQGPSGQIYPPQGQGVPTPVSPPAAVPPQSPPPVQPPPAATTAGPLPVYTPPPSSKKRIFIIVGVILFLLIVVASIFLFALSRGSSSNDQDVTITYWGLWDDESVFHEVIQDFERENPHIHVKYEKQDIQAVGKYMDRLNARINKGDGPDVYRFHNSWVPQLVGQNLLSPLPNSTLDATQFKDQNYDFVKNDMQKNGAYYGIPLGIDTLCLFINEDLLAQQGLQVPTTWEDLQSISKKLTIGNSETGQIDVSGVALGTFDNIAHAPDIVSLLMVQNGANLTDLGGPQRQNAVEVLDFYTSFAKGDNAVWNNDLPNSKLMFKQGKLAMYFGYSWDILEIQANNPDLKFKVVPVPHLTGRDETIASYWVEGVSSKTKYPKQSFLFLQYLAKQQSIEKIFAAQTKQRGLGTPYPRVDMAKLLANNSLLYPVIQQAPTAVSTIFSSDTYDEGFVTALNGYMANAVNSIITNDNSPESAIDTLSAGVKQVFSGGK